MKKLVKPVSTENRSLYLYEGYCLDALLRCLNQSQGFGALAPWVGLGCGIGYLSC